MTTCHRPRGHTAREKVVFRFDANHPCPVCGSGTKGCSVTESDLHFCRSPDAPPGWKELRRADNGFGCYRRDDDHRSPPPPKATIGKGMNWKNEAARYRGTLTADLLAELASNLGVPGDALAAIGTGWADRPPAWTFPETDGTGAIIGISHRSRSGEKKAFSGGRRGLTLPHAWATRPGPVFVVEGPTDTAAMTAAGLACVGRPSNCGGIDHLAVLLNGQPTARAIIVVGENDKKPDGLWPGRDGAVSVARGLARKLGRLVRFTLPPTGAKDVRQWLSAPSRAALPWAGRGRELLAHLMAEAKPATVADDTAAACSIGDRVCPTDRDNVGVVTEVMPGGRYRVRFVGKDGTAEKVFTAAQLRPWPTAASGQGKPPPAPPRPYTPFPTEHLPGPAARFVEAVSRALPCDPAYVALPVLAVLAGAVGMARVLRIKRSWTEPPIVWAAVVGYSGTVKSPAEEFASRPLVEIEHELGEAHREADRKYRAELDAYKKAKREAERDGREPTNPPPARPAARRAVLSDVTIESLGVILEDNPKGVLVRRDELRGWFESFTRYSKASDAPQWLELHRGGSLTIDRKTGDKLTVRASNAAASVCGGIQPDILARVFSGEAFASGLAARLLLAMPPRQAKKWTDDDVPDAVAAEFAAVVRRLHALEPDDTGSRPAPREVTLSAEALAAFKPFVDYWGERTSSAEANLAAAFSKLEGGAARFALIHHLTTLAAQGRDDCPPVPEQSMRAGIALAEWFAAETDRVYLALSEDDAARDRRLLVEMIGRRPGGRITTRELQRSNTRKYPTKENAEQALDDLAEAGCGRWEESQPPGGGHPKREFVLDLTAGERDTTPEPRATDGSCVVPHTAFAGHPTQAGGTDDADRLEREAISEFGGG